MRVTIAGQTLDSHTDNGHDLFVEGGSLRAALAIGQRSTADFSVVDADGTHDYEQGMPVIVYHDNGLRAFGGVITSDEPTQPAQADLLRHTIQCSDWHYLADKRKVAASYDDRTIGFIVNDILLNYLIAEGVLGLDQAPILTRASSAYYLNGSTDPFASSVASGVARYEAGEVAGSKAIRIEEGVTNLLSANQSDVESGTTGFSAAASTILNAGATITRDGAHKFAGSYALKIVTTNASSSQGAEAQISGLAANTKYAITVWLDGTNGNVWQLCVRDFTNGVQQTANVTCGADWTRVRLIITTGASAVTDFRVAIKTTTAVAQTVWADGWQVEQKAHYTSWHPGGATRAKETLQFPAVGCLNPRQGTIQFRAYTDANAKRQDGTGTSSPYLYGIDSPNHSGSSMGLYHSNNQARWIMNINQTQWPSCEDSYTPDGWHRFAITWDDTELLVYIDGTERIRQNTPTLDTSFGQYLYLGSDGGGNSQTNTLFQDYRTFSRKRLPSEIAADAALSSWLPPDAGATHIAHLNNDLTSDAPSIDAGATVHEFISDHASAAECFDALSRDGDMVWQIDADQLMWMKPQGAVTGPAITAIDIDLSSLKVQRTNPQYRNRQIILGGRARTEQQVEIRVGDGYRTVFPMSYPLATVPTIEVNLNGAGYVAQTVGIGGLDTGKQWYWNGGKNEVFQDTDETKLRGPTGTIDLLRVTYVGEFPTVIQSNDEGEQITARTREGQGTGIVEDVVTNSGLSSLEAGFEMAAGYLTRYAQLGKAVTFRTDLSGFAPGQLIDVHLPDFNINHESLLIESVGLAHDGLTLWATVKALRGPINSTWANFYATLYARATTSIERINLGAGNSVALQVGFTAARSSSASFAVTVYACPVFPYTFPVTFC